MRRPWSKLALAIAALALASCAPKPDVTRITVQRIFGECRSTGAGARNPDGECEIITGLLDQFQRENPDIRLKVNIAAWPGYDQLSAQFAAGDPPDLVTMHMSAISDYQSRRLIEPMGPDLAKVGIQPAAFTRAAREGVTKAGQVYGLPFDNWAPLWHINLNQFRQAGLVRDGQPVLPTSADELLAQARQFRRATGKPYLVQAMANETASYTRNLYTYLLTQNAAIFPDPKHIKLTTPEAHRVVALFKQLYAEDLTTKDQDYAAATSGFMNGDGGVYLVGTWMIGAFEAEAKSTGRPLSGGYAVVPYPRLFGTKDAAYVDGHAWVAPARQRTPAQRAAVYRLARFLADHDYDWSRTGHLPAMQAVIDSPRFKALPHRQAIAPLAVIGQSLPPGVQRQFAIQDIIGDEMASAITGRKPIDTALADAERRVNDLLFHLL
ncbi:MAG: extracellular solute-binding protein [Caulobacter sp.]|nr:extracellular solute-binding protein [Caulobacter sp.]